jgi:hypothetical protein
MRDLTPTDQAMLLGALARREGTAREIAWWYSLSPEELTEFVAENRPVLETMRAEFEREQEEAEQADTEPGDPALVTPLQLDQLWISNKAARLTRYQQVSDVLYRDLAKGHLSGSDLSTAAREFRSYLQLAANELGQLLHRGAGDSGDADTLSLDIQGVDIDSMR